MIGLLEQVLTKHYGAPTVVRYGDLVEHRWNEDTEPLRCLLFKSVEPPSRRTTEHRDLDWIYGDAVGGFLLLDSLKLAMIVNQSAYGLYTIDELRTQPEVIEANALDAEITFFMDSANVWFYGVKEQHLYVYDSEARDLADLGPVERALPELLRQWEEAKTSDT